MSDTDVQAGELSLPDETLGDSPSQPEEDRSGSDGGSASGESSLGGERSDDDASAARDLPYGTVFDLLSNERRRFTLRYLNEHGSSSLGELAEELAARENDKPRERITSQERKRTYVGLYQCHFPKLEDADVIRSDRSLSVTLGPNADQLLEHLDVDREPRSRFHLPYAVATGVGLLGLGAWALLPGTWLGPLVTAVALVLVLIVAGIHSFGVPASLDIGTDRELDEIVEAVRPRDR